MRGILVLGAALLAATTLVEADPHNLAGGALIFHNAGSGFRYPPTCETYFQYNPITNCDEQVNTMESGGADCAWFVIAAFDEDKEWCGVQFGLGDFDPFLVAFGYSEACFPGGGLTIPSPGWPGPLEGIALAATPTPWAGNFQPVYCFNVYAYGYYGPGLVQLIPDPTVSNPFGGFCNCADPPAMWDAALGGIGIDQPGTWVCWGWHESVCCIGSDCVIVPSENECTDLGGAYHPEWDSCGPPNPCEGTPATTVTWGRVKDMYR